MLTRIALLSVTQFILIFRSEPLRTLCSALLLCFRVAASEVVAQSSPKRIFLSPKSNITTSEIAEGFAKNCPNVVLTQNDAKADHILEAAETVTADEGKTYDKWHFTLMNRDGDVLMTTHPEMHWGSKTKHHFQSICKFINK
jgi:hypothetical protein